MKIQHIGASLASQLLHIARENNIHCFETTFLGLNVFKYLNLELHVATHLCLFSSNSPYFISSLQHTVDLKAYEYHMCFVIITTQGNCEIKLISISFEGHCDGDCQEYCLLGCDAVQSSRGLALSQRTVQSACYLLGLLSDPENGDRMFSEMTLNFC